MRTGTGLDQWTEVSGEPVTLAGLTVCNGDVVMADETGVVAIPEALTSVTVSQPITYANGDQVQYLELTFRCRAVGGEAHVNDEESLEVRWQALNARARGGVIGNGAAGTPEKGERLLEAQSAHIAKVLGTAELWSAKASDNWG